MELIMSVFLPEIDACVKEVKPYYRLYEIKPDQYMNKDNILIREYELEYKHRSLNENNMNNSIYITIKSDMTYYTYSDIKSLADIQNYAIDKYLTKSINSVIENIKHVKAMMEQIALMKDEIRDAALEKLEKRAANKL